jgi:hypothetical protein
MWRCSCAAPIQTSSTGNGRKPIVSPPHDGCCNVAPLLPQPVQSAHCRNLSLDTSAPQRIMKGTIAAGA